MDRVPLTDRLDSHGIAYRHIRPQLAHADCASDTLEAVGPAERVITVRGEWIAGDKYAILDGLAAACEFPAYFGRNWDALTDCLDELPYRTDPEADVLLIISGYPALLRNSVPNDLRILLDVLNDLPTSGDPRFPATFPILCN
ncbi:barstar family protein [Glycomyces buryatensis]|uniref:Barstar (barnase inhibitor) domain-containing protein n=1 Tax=Glycomyces buryatensis TaxID=2570927 RepID=A0A4S8QDS9_9ACTN|nr:barstar family protein [Glycomyces buryatensis]THV42470.1 hypothetical protein FAB82_06240 [Glycomyces buryatensis]